MKKQVTELVLQKNPGLKNTPEKLQFLVPGAFCIHRGWGFGEIKDYDESTNKFVIDFEGDKVGHMMDPVFCAEKLEFLSPDHFYVRYKKDHATLEKFLRDNPVQIVMEALATSPRRAMSPAELESVLSRLMGESKFKKWWPGTKKLLVKDPRVGVPAKKTDLYVLREEPLTPEREILEEFYANKNAKKKILLAERLSQLATSVDEISNDLPRILEDITGSLKSARDLRHSDRLHGVWVRNDLAQMLGQDVEELEPSASEVLMEADDIDALAEELPASYYRRFFDLTKEAYPDRWKEVGIGLLRNGNGKLISECINFLYEAGCEDLVMESFKKALNEQALKGPVIYWILKNRSSKRFRKVVKDLLTPRLLSATFNAIDFEALHATSNKRIALVDLLSEDSDLITDLLADSSMETAKDLAQRLLHSHGIENLTKKSLLARFIKHFPAIQSLVAGENPQESEQQLVVSKESYELRKQEYELLVTEKIPENKKAIAAAREHGDLRENSEYKMARQDQEMLLAKKNLLEAELSKARVTDFADATKETIGIGSVVELYHESSKKTYRYAILGAWDSNPKQHILSYKTPLAQGLLGRKNTERVTLQIDNNKDTWAVKKIERWVDCQSGWSV